MTLPIFLEMTAAAAATVWSPGPNNILLLSTTSKYGIRKNLKLMLGIWTGSLTLMCLCGIFCSALSRVVPGLQPIMKYIGAAYILFLAWQTLRRKPPREAAEEKSPSYLMGILLQLLNIKIMVYGLTMFSSYIIPYETRPSFLFLYAVYLMFLGAVGNLIWAFAGSLLKGLYASHYRLMNAAMALLLAWCSLRIIGII